MSKFLTTLLLLLVLFGSTPAVTPPRSLIRPIKPNSPVANIPVWVNTNSGIYHCPRTRWWGRTKVGVFMKQRQAQVRGFRPAYDGACTQTVPGLAVVR